MSLKTKISFFLISKFKKIKRFINKFLHNMKLKVKSFIKQQEFAKKIKKLIVYVCEVAFTGIIIYYAITHFNWISVGLIAALSVYYVEWLIKLIKRKEE